MNDEISRLFPDFKQTSSDAIYNNKLKRYILSACQIYSSEENPSEYDIRELQKQKNWFLIKDGNFSNLESELEIERNYLMLISYLELSENSTVLQFYSKLDYLNKKNKREEEQWTR